MNDRKPDKLGSGVAEDGARVPYERPQIAWEEDWDVRANLASACGKQAGTTLECNADPSS
jgi:hypothetical protein